MANHLVQARWRQDPVKARGSLAPQLLDPALWQNLNKQRLQRFVLSTCNFDYLQAHLHCLQSYERSSSSLPFLCGIYCSIDDLDKLKDELQRIRKELNFSKIVFFFFTCPGLDWVNSQQQDPEIRWDYLINYIRSARYILIRQIWDRLGILNANLSLHQAASYVVDLDNEVKADFDSIISRLYGLKRLILSWNSLQSASQDFPATLSGIAIRRDANSGIKYSVNHPYKILKAGFSVFAPSEITRIFLELMELYSIGDHMSKIYLRLFTFYFNDQVSMLLALNDIKSSIPAAYNSQLQWIDVSTSKIVNLEMTKAACMWYPKGKSLKSS
jgi:hypothetical protein